MKYYKFIDKYNRTLLRGSGEEIPEGAVEISKEEYEKHQDKDDDMVI